MTITAGARSGAYVRASVLGGFGGFVISKGGDPAALLERSGIDPCALSMPDSLISFADTGTLLEIAAEDLNIPSFGLEWALGVAPQFAIAGPALLLRETAGTFGEWMERSVQYWRLQTNGLIPEIVKDDGAIAVRISPCEPTHIPRQQMEHVAGTFVCLARSVDGRAGPVRVRFRHTKPEDTGVHDLLFRCPLEFGKGRDEILFDIESAANPIAGEAKALEAITDAFLRHRIGLLPRYKPSVSTSTALVIKIVLGVGVCSKEFVAVALGCTPRKLQRLLAQEGTTYEEIFDGVRKELASQFLFSDCASIASVAAMLEFSSTAALTLAVRRWTGMTPGRYRASLRQAAEA